MRITNMIQIKHLTKNMARTNKLKYKYNIVPRVLHHTFSLGPARFTALRISALLPTSAERAVIKSNR